MLIYHPAVEKVYLRKCITCFQMTATKTKPVAHHISSSSYNYLPMMTGQYHNERATIACCMTNYSLQPTFNCEVCKNLHFFTFL